MEETMDVSMKEIKDALRTLNAFSSMELWILYSSMSLHYSSQVDLTTNYSISNYDKVFLFGYELLKYHGH